MRLVSFMTDDPCEGPSTYVMLPCFLFAGPSVSGQIWPCLCPCCLCASEVSKSSKSAGTVTVINSLSLESISPSSPLQPNSAEEPNRSLRYYICVCVAREKSAYCIQECPHSTDQDLVTVYTSVLKGGVFV